MHIGQVDTEFPGQLKVGMQVPLRAEVSLGELAPEDIRVELYSGRLNAQHKFNQTTVYPLELQRSNGEGVHYFSGTFACSESGSHGCNLRVLPSHHDLRNPLEMGLIRWERN